MALSFDGSTDSVSFPTGTFAQINGDLSIGVWVKFGTSNVINNVIVANGGVGDTEGANAYWLIPRTSASSLDIDYGHEYSAGSDEIHTFNTNLANSTWTYLAISRDTTAKTVSLWTSTGGALSLVESWGYTNNPTGGGDSGNFLVLGDWFSGGFTIDADMANFNLYDRALTVGEHQQNMVGHLVRGNIKVYTPMWLNGADLSGNAHNGTVNGAVVADHAPIGPYIPQSNRTAFRTAVAVVLEQEGYRFRNDDGSEAGATWRQLQDVDDTIAKNINFRLRMLLNATGNPDTDAYKLQYKESTDGDTEYRDVPVA